MARRIARSLGMAALLCIALGCLALVRMDPPTGPRHDMAPLPNAGNGRISEVPTDAQGHWAVQVLSDIQDGFPYMPRLLREGVEYGAQAVVIAGDLATGDGGEHLSLLLRELQLHPPAVPLFAVPGNHDNLTQADREQFDAVFGGAEFEFRIGSTRFIGIDSTTAASRAQARVTLRSKLRVASSAGERSIVICHHSPLDWGHRNDDVAARLDSDLADIFSDPGVALVISGHVHRERSDRLAGVRFVKVPPSGDRSAGGLGQAPVSYLMLRWNGERFLLERHQFARQNDLELEATLRDDVFAHLQPWLWTLLGRGGSGGAVQRARAGIAAAPGE